MTSDSMVSRTQNFDARIEDFGFEPSRSALAARSLAKVDRIKDEGERRDAFRRHLDEFPPAYSLA